MRDRLIELLKQAEAICNSRKECEGCAGDGKEGTECLDYHIADYLLANGVIVPPKVIGEKVWYVCEGQVQFTLIEGIEPALRLIGFPRPITRRDIGTLIFLTREEAEQVLKSDKDINVPVKAED